jgi:polar amino acid transport system substrate-binding protein
VTNKEKRMKHDRAGRTRRSVRAAAAAGAAGLALALLSGCGGGGKSGGSGDSASASASPAASGGSAVAGVAEVPSIAAMVPAPFRKSGVIKDITYNDAPPDEYVDGGDLVGWEVDLAKATAQVLGLKVEITGSGSFDSFIPGLQNHRYDVSFTSWVVTPEREKVLDLVSMFQSGTGFAVPQSSTLKVSAITDLCGAKVAVIQGSAFVEQLKAADTKCTAAGKPAIQTSTFPSDAAAELAVGSGRAQVYATSSNQLPYLIEQSHKAFAIQPLDYLPTPIAVGTSQGNGLAKPIAAALQHLMDDGTYDRVLKQYGVDSGRLTKAAVLPAG